jgi:hypothetical protein
VARADDVLCADGVVHAQVGADEVEWDEEGGAILGGTREAHK